MAKDCTGGTRAAIIAWNPTTKERRFTPQLREPRHFLEDAAVSAPYGLGDVRPAQSVGVLVCE